MNEEMLKLLDWLNKEKALALSQTTITSDTDRYFNGKLYGKYEAFSLCISKIKEICGCDGK